MQIDATSSTTSTTSSASGTGLEGNRDEFLRLFLAQLQHQDPLDPQSGSDLVAQLAQLSQVEQAAETNKQLLALGDSLATSSTAGMAALVGRTCAATAGTSGATGVGVVVGVGVAVVVASWASTASMASAIACVAGGTATLVERSAGDAGDGCGAIGREGCGDGYEAPAGAAAVARTVAGGCGATDVGTGRG